MAIFNSELLVITRGYPPVNSQFEPGIFRGKISETTKRIGDFQGRTVSLPGAIV